MPLSQKNPLTSGAMIGLGVGAAALVAGIGYLMFRAKPAAAATAPAGGSLPMTTGGPQETDFPSIASEFTPNPTPDYTAASPPAVNSTPSLVSSTSGLLVSVNVDSVSAGTADVTFADAPLTNVPLAYLYANS